MIRKLKYTLIVVFTVYISTAHSQKFREVSNEKGLNYYYPGHHRQEVGAGITVFDINNDGWDDIFQSCGNFESKVWINHRGQFKDETDKYLPDSLEYRHIQGAIAGDFDNDGYEDLILTNLSFYEGDKKPPVLLKNLNGESFVQVFNEVFTEQGNYPSAAWGDINGDGFIDLYLLCYVKNMSVTYDSLDNFYYIPECLPNKFYINQGGLELTELAAQLSINDSGCGLACMFTDFDNDSDVDLILLNDFGSWNHLGNRIYRNNYPEFSFTDVSVSSGLYEEFYGMGIGIGDIDQDGDFDYYFTNIGPNSLMLNQKDRFENVADNLEVGLGFYNNKKSTSWSGIFFDVENDGDLDLILTKGYLESLEKPTINEVNKLMINKGNGKFVDKSKQSKITDSISNRGAAFFDFDHDGDLDLVTNSLQLGRSEFAGRDQKIKLYENVTRNKNHWIAIKLEGLDSVNRSAIGCSVRFQIKDKWYIREVDGGSGHCSQSSKMMYFGLGKNKKISNIQINWIGGGKTVITELDADKCYLIKTSGEITVIY
ncbi:MAG: CRTAC1 family protein [Flavobacteriales bacterium]|nr:CRTAC1 family protein [Flavobacteriales bacterium]